MKTEKIYEAMTEIDEKYLSEAHEVSQSKRSLPLRIAIAAAAVVLLIGTISGIYLFWDGAHGCKPSGSNTLTKVLAKYPEPYAPHLSAENYLFSRDRVNWVISQQKAVEASSPIAQAMDTYYFKVMQEVLAGSNDNTIFSPLNIYMALSMLAEVTGGNSRQQLLDLLSVNDIDTLRHNIAALWQSNYADTPIMKSLLANSLWLNGTRTYNESTLQTLADNYYASSFVGDPADDSMNKALQQWVNGNTGGLLTQYTSGLTLDPNTVLALVSTIYFKASWANIFADASTDKQTFHGLNGDTSVDMMHSSDRDYIYIGNNFMAYEKKVIENGKLYFFLPDEGVSVESLLETTEYLNVIRSTKPGNHWYHRQIRASIPKFKISQQTDLLEKLVALGVTDVLSYSIADFSPLLAGPDKNNFLCLSLAEHAATFEIDEEGVSGSAYTFLDIPDYSGRPIEEIEIVDFTLNRPFLFILTGADGSILFSGIVKDIE